VPVKVGGKTVHILAMHPTPPNFDGSEDRNGKRNFDEIRLMADYLSPDKGAYIYDDNGEKVSLSENARFVLVGDFNAADIGDKHREGVIEQLTEHPLVNKTSFQQAQAVQARQVQSLVTALLPIGEPELTMFCHLDLASM